MSASVWAAETNAASNWLHGRYTPRSSISQNKRAKSRVSLGGRRSRVRGRVEEESQHVADALDDMGDAGVDRGAIEAFGQWAESASSRS